MAGLESITSPKLKCKPKRGPEHYCRLQGSVHCFLHIPFLRKNPGFVVGLAVLEHQGFEGYIPCKKHSLNEGFGTPWIHLSVLRTEDCVVSWG